METGPNKLKQLKRQIRKDPYSYAANLQMGMFYLGKEDIPSAAGYLEKASETGGDKAELFFVLANVHKSLGNHEKSELYFRKSVDLEPENYEYLYNYGLLLQETGKLPEAIETFGKAAGLDASNYELRNDIGVLYYQKGDYDEALSLFAEALRIKPGYSLASINMGYVYLARGDLQKTRTLLNELAASCPRDPEFIELERQLEKASHEVRHGSIDICTELTFSDQLLEITPLKIIKDFGEKASLQDIGLSIVVPIHNEETNIPILYGELIDVLNNLKEKYEIIFVDDGSTDGSTQALDHIAAGDPDVKIIHFRKNYGQTAAMNAGFKYACGHVVITMDGDLQNDPADIPRLLEKMSEGYDLVSGWRKDRKDTLVTRKVPSMVANRIINKLIEGTGVQLHDYGCTLKAYKRGIIKNINLYGEMHRFIPVFAAWLGVKVTEIPVNHRPRVHGYAKYNLSRVSRVIFDLVVVRFFSDYMTRPIQFFGKIAKKLVAAGIVLLILLGLLSAFTSLSVPFASFVILGALLLFAALQIISIGLLGELMMRSYFETQKKDSYVVEKITNERAL